MRFASFREFWPFYVREHSSRANRVLHVIGTSLALCSIVAAIVLARPALLGLAAVCGYSFAWFGHFVIEKNRPATIKHPFYSLAGDFVMLVCILSGRMAAELAKAVNRPAT
jgi:hypothetical protein